MGAAIPTTSNILPFRRRDDPLAYAPGVPAFDRSNPLHVHARNTIVQMAIQADRLNIIDGEDR